MTSQPNRHTRLWTAAASGVAFLCLAVACETPRPQGAITEPEAPAAATLNAVPIGEVPNYRPKILNDQEVMLAMENGYPPAHRTESAKVLVRFVIDAAGVPQDVHVIEGAEIPEFDAAAVRAIEQARFNAPPRPVIGTMPIIFAARDNGDKGASRMVQAGSQGRATVRVPPGAAERAANTPEIVRLRELARKHEGVSGQMTFTIQPDGSVSDLRILRSTGDPALDETFLATARARRFRPSEQAHELTVPILPPTP